MFITQFDKKVDKGKSNIAKEGEWKKKRRKFNLHPSEDHDGPCRSTRKTVDDKNREEHQDKITKHVMSTIHTSLKNDQ